MVGKVLTTVAATCLLLNGAAMAGDETEGPTLTIGDAAPAIDIAHWVKGVEVTKGEMDTITEFEDGKVYVLEFWATWCGPCKASMPHLTKLQEKYRDYDVTIIGVSDEPLPTVINFLFQNDKYDDTLNNDRTQYTLCTDPDKSVKTDYMRAAGRDGIPCAFIIGKEGHVEWIGHPMEMDGPLDDVVRNSWDRDKFRTVYINRQKSEKALGAAYKEKDWDTVVEILEDRIAENPEKTDLLYRKFMVLLVEMDDPTQAYAFGQKVVKANWDDAQMLNAIAWTVADSKKVTRRDFDFALTAANRANELTDSKDPAILDTLARVHFEQGDVKKAIKIQTMAAEYAGDDGLGSQIRKTLAEYEAK